VVKTLEFQENRRKARLDWESAWAGRVARRSKRGISCPHATLYAARSVRMAISGATPTRIGGPVVPSPEFT